MSTQGATKRRATQAVDKPVKRTRVSRACDQCRTAREKCDGAQPICSTCSASRRVCTYTANVKKRGIQPGYIRALELALAFLFQHDPGNEALVNDKLAEGGSSSLLLSRNSKDSNKLHKRWRKARFYADVDKLLSGGEPSRHDQSEPLSQDSDEKQSDTEEPSSVVAFSAPNLGNVQDQLLAQLPDEWIPRLLTEPETQGTHLSMPPDSWRLLETYFTYSQSWLPICSKEAILRVSYSYPMEGLALSPHLPDSGSHAELWSVLAVASLYNTEIAPTQQSQSSMTTAQLYATSRSLIPEETGYFDLSHVKAILNLAIINVGCLSIESAWLLVGCAMRMLEIMDQSLLMADSKYNHVLRGCFVLDSFLAMHLGRRTYFRAHEVRQSGRIDEDGLEEWQPWNDQSGHSSRQHLRTPTLALSSFTALSDLVSLVSGDWKSDEDKSQYLEAWKSTLPSKLASVCATNYVGSLTPPAVLLQSTYYCIAFALTSSESWLLRVISLLERSEDQLGWRKLPPLLRCLVEFLNKRIDGVSLGRGVQNRLLRLRAAISAAWPKLGNMCTPAARVTQAAVTATIPTPEYFLQQPNSNVNKSAAPPLFHPTTTDTRSRALPIHQSHRDIDVSTPIEADTRFPAISSDLETFFDELASLDTPHNPGSQPQFMQNLGFAPDANMADLFSEYIPMSTAFMSQDNDVTVTLDHYGFFDNS